MESHDDLLTDIDVKARVSESIENFMIDWLIVVEDIGKETKGILMKSLMDDFHVSIAGPR